MHSIPARPHPSHLKDLVVVRPYFLRKLECCDTHNIDESILCCSEDSTDVTVVFLLEFFNG